MICGYQNWLEESLMQVKDDDDLHRGQRSTEILIINTALLDGYQTWSEERLMQVKNDGDLH